MWAGRNLEAEFAHITMEDVFDVTWPEGESSEH